MASDPTSKRVRQSDRDDVVDALSSAFADGQITAKDHERRVGTALRARRDSVLTNLLRDIRLPDGHPARELVEPPREAGPVPARERRRLPGLAAGVGLAVAGGVALLVVVGIVDTVTDDSGDPAPTVLSAEGIEQFVDDIDEEFGTTEVIAVDFKQTWADVLVPAESGSGRYLRYTYSVDDSFSESQNGTLATDDPALVDLASSPTTMATATSAAPSSPRERTPLRTSRSRWATSSGRQPGSRPTSVAAASSPARISSSSAHVTPPVGQVTKGTLP
jgi:hypothetical protein